MVFTGRGDLDELGGLMLKGRAKRFEIWTTTAELVNFNTVLDTSPLAATRQPSAECLLRFTVTGSVGVTQSIGVAGSTVETVAIGSGARTYWSVNTYTALNTLTFQPGIDDCTVVIEQFGRDREPIQQLKTTGKYIYLGLLDQATGGIDRIPAGEIADTDSFNLLVPRRFGDCGILTKDWIRDTVTGFYFRVESLLDFPDGHKELRVQRAQV
jgi:hypothetical protein